MSLALQRVPRLAWAGIAGLLACAAWFHGWHPAVTGYGFAAAVFAGLLVVSCVLVGLVLALLPAAYGDAWRGRKGAVRAVLALVFGLLLGVVLPLGVRPVEPVAFSVTALGTHSGASSSSEAWVRVEADGYDVPADAASTDGHWQVRDTTLISTPPAQPATASWYISAHKVRVVFVGHPWSGRVRVVAHNQSQDLDLYRAAGQEEPIPVVLVGEDTRADRLALFPARDRKQWLAFCVDALLLGGLLVFLFDLARGTVCLEPGDLESPPELGRVGRFDVIAFAWPQLLVYLVYLALFFPGILTSDSADQWAQATTGQWVDWHPPLYGLLMRGLRLIWDSPAAVASLQAVVMAAAIGYLIAAARAAARAPRWTAYAGAVACAIFPIVASDVVTLWKDVLYSAAVVFLVGFTITVTCLRRPVLRRPAWLILASVAIITCITLRYNGLPLLLVILGLMMIAAPVDRWRALMLVVFAVGVAHMINGPLFDALGTRRTHVSFSIALHHIAAHQAAGEALPTAEDRALIRDIWPVDGPLPYSCAYGGVTIFDPRLRGWIAIERHREIVDLARRLAIAHPAVEMKHLACVSALVWRLSRSYDESIELADAGVRKVDGVIRWVVDNDQGLHEAPFLGQTGARARASIYTALDRSGARRPAFFLYLLLFCGAVAASRQARWELGACVMLAVLAQSASIFFFNVAQDPRYQLPVVILGLALAPLLLAAGRITPCAKQAPAPAA